MEIYNIIMHEPPLATLHQLDTIYNTEDVDRMLEMIEIRQAIEFDRNKAIKEQKDNAKAKR